MLRNEFSSLDLVRALNFKHERIRAWEKASWVRPTIPSPGQGRPATWTRKDAYLLFMVGRLIDQGATGLRASAIAAGFFSEMARHFEGAEWGIYAERGNQAIHCQYRGPIDFKNWKLYPELGGFGANSITIFDLGEIRGCVDLTLPD